MVRDLADRLRRLPNGIVWLLGAIPLALLVWDIFTGGLGIDPVRDIEHRLGRTALYFVIGSLCFTPAQAILAAKAGATFISPFIGRLDDIGLDGMELIADIRRIYDNYGYETNVLAASIRSVNHIIECARIGADVITAPPAVIKAMASHILTDKGLEQFNADWAKTGQKIGL